jgi:hypothetical protein
MPRQQTALAELGRVAVHDDHYRAHAQYRNSAGANVNIYGPDRCDRRRAEADLAQMRAAGAISTTREQGLQIMAAEARRLQVSAGFEADVRAAVQRQRDEEEEEAVYVSDEEPEEDDPWMLEHPLTEDLPATPPSQKAPLTPHEADVALQGFRPIKARPEDLKHILYCRADPNKPLTVPGDLNPLRKVLCFARERHVVEMRQLLLDHGADETDDDRKRWVTRQQADLYERIRIRESREDLRAYDPCGAAMERNI